MLGNLPSLARGGLDYVKTQQDELGDLYQVKAGPQPVVLLNHPEHARHVLITHADNYLKQGTFWSAVRSLIGLGLPTIEGDSWRVRRRMMNPQFRRARLVELGVAMVDTIDAQLDEWPQDGATIDVSGLVSQVTMAVIVRTMFGADLASSEAAAMAESLSFCLDHLLQKVVTDALPVWIPVPGRRAHLEAVARVDELLYAIIRRRRADSDDRDDLLTMLLEMRDEGGDSGSGLNDQELRDETMSLFVAGYETTAVAVSWGLARMALDPELYERLVAEVDAVLGTRTPTPDDVSRLPLTSQFFMETLRLDAPVFFLARTAAEDDVIDGHAIPAGTMVAMIIDRIHRHPSAWEQPDQFDLDRFSPERSEGRHACAWIPFGVGQRQCIGKSFAMMEGVFLLAMLVQRFRFEAVEATRLEMRLAITKRPRHGIVLRVLPRA